MGGSWWSVCLACDAILDAQAASRQQRNNFRQALLTDFASPRYREVVARPHLPHLAPNLSSAGQDPGSGARCLDL
jgi:hypothetical protein